MAAHAAPMAFAAAALACAMTATGAQAQTAPATAEIPPMPAASEAAAPLPLSDLAQATAGAAADVNVLSNQQLTATNSGNSVNAETVQSGNIDFSDSAFSGFNGVGNFVFNTGANNNLQGVVSVNVVSVPEL